MKEGFPHPLRCFRNPCYAVWTYQRPCHFQHFINEVLRPFSDDFVTTYLDDILINSNILGEQKIPFRCILKKVSEVGLRLQADKCEFHKEKVSYLGMIISKERVSMDPR